MIGSTLIEQKAAVLFLFSSKRPCQHQGNIIKQTSLNNVIRQSAFQYRTILFQLMKIEEVVFVQANRSFDLSDPIQLATFGVFIYSNMEHKINKIYRNLYTSGKLMIRQLTRCIYFHNMTITSEIISR